jgi:glycosyl transferase family 25
MKLSNTVYVLGLERNFRGTELVNVLKKYFIDVNVFLGFDAYSSPKSEVQKFLDFKQIRFLMHRDISLGEAGCAISHKLIYEDIVLKKASSALILEDDSIITDAKKLVSIMGEFNQLLISKPKSPIAVQLGSLHFKYSQNNDKPILKKAQFPSYGTFGYVLSQSAAVMLTKNSAKISSTADWPIKALELDWYRSRQPVIDVQIDNSTISKDRTEIFSAENQKHNLHYIQRYVRYFSTILGIRTLIAKRYKISSKLSWKWDYEYKYWRKKQEKRVKNHLGEFLR